MVGQRRHRAHRKPVGCAAVTSGFSVNCKKMNLPKNALEEFRLLWRKKYGVEIPDEDAVDLATRLLQLVYFVQTASKEAYATKHD